ncbi:hypothetical protein GPEL0_01f3157 [Geoanaerobacter pelophilus]|uniref:Uncharacterized protein n=1 Tax=Geoanaerobacter pelophilus TaxID=60036 RepID=A0ABQ0MJW2_9BACT|nr:hypothetical protein GPEL0_01f3157 [Geoanaerobacter pelophilus]
MICAFRFDGHYFKTLQIFLCQEEKVQKDKRRTLSLTVGGQENLKDGLARD